ncbi:MAG TPA: FAD-dependent oxidoreductase [Bacillota bacterium]
MAPSARTIVVVGGVAAGASAAAKARREDEQARIVVFEQGEHVSFANCGLPYFVGGEIADRGSLLLHTPGSLRDRFNLDVRVNTEVTEIIPARRLVRAKDLKTGEVDEVGYDSLVIATGSRPVVPTFAGAKSRNVQVLRTVPEAEQLRRRLRSGHAKRAVVIGAGFIGLEVVENLRRQGVEVALADQADQVLPPLDPEMTVPIEDALRSLGVEVALGRGLRGFIQRGGKAVAAELEDGTRVEGDIFLLSIGAVPDVDLAARSGIALGPTGAIAVNDRMETSIPGIYAAGDAVETVNRVTGRPAWMPLAGPAQKQGRVAGANAAGRSMTFKGAYGTAIVRVGGVVAAKTGLGEGECRAAGIDCRVAYNYHGDHAGYYPGSQGMFIKLLAERRAGRLVGAQIVGGRGVDKRIDVLATAIAGRMGVTDLEDLDLAYAPPFGAARDPVIMAGMTQANLQRGEIDGCTPAELAGWLGGADLQLVDVRDPAEWAGGIIEGAVTIPLPELRRRLNELDPARPTVIYCLSGQRSYFATRILKNSGFSKLQNLTGGFLGWTFYVRSRERSAGQVPRPAGAVS